MTAGGTPEQHQFDFWLGDWDVTSANGKPAGTNRVEKILNGCVVRESWVGAAEVPGAAEDGAATGTLNAVGPPGFEPGTNRS